jgi:predicted O-linked N-acetylglucosamine transferase (SPINDLY family)
MSTDADLQQTVNHQHAPASDEPSAAQLAALAGEFIATIETLTARGLHDEAEALARQMVTLVPTEGFGWKTLAYAHLRRGNLLGAREPLRQCATLLPPDAELARHLQAATAMHEGLLLDQSGRYAEAGKQYQMVLQAYPNHPDASHRLGVVALRLSQPEAAIPLLETALGANPGNGQYWANYVDALIQSGQLKAAWIALEMGQQHGMTGPVAENLISLMSTLSNDTDARLQRLRRFVTAPRGPAAQQPKPKLTPAESAKTSGQPNQEVIAEPPRQHLEDAVALFNARRFNEAEARARALVEAFPQHPLGWKVLGISLYNLGRYAEAVKPMATARELSPRDSQVLHISATVLEGTGKHEEAERACREFLEVSPNNPEALRILSIILMSLTRLDEAEQACLQALQGMPESALVPTTLGTVYMKQGRLAEASAQYRRAIELDPSRDLNWSNLLFSLTHSEELDPVALFAEHRRFGKHFETPLKPNWPKHANKKDPERPLRVGFISGDFRRHAVASFFEPVLQHLARDASLSLYAYSNTPGSDEVTERMRRQFVGWHNICQVGSDIVAGLIRADGIDILIDLAGHTAENRLVVMAYKPAPLQASWIGHPGTTGMSAVDYFMADRFWVPSERYSSQFTEKIARLPALAPFLPEREAPPVNLLPALHKGYVTFGSFNRLDKLHREVVALWSQLLRALPTSRMLIGAMPTDGSATGRLAGWFAEEGIARDRLDFRPRGTVPVFLQQHHHVDICLDTLPFGGLTTALQSLWMGVPTLTLPGPTVPGRSGATAMGHAGLEEYVAIDEQDFVRRGIAAAADLPALATLRAGMRERCMQSPMFRPEMIAAGASEALRVMWRRWCNGLPAESFDVYDAARTDERSAGSPVVADAHGNS